jgi:hypothetical protein
MQSLNIISRVLECVVWLKMRNMENITDRNAIDSPQEVKLMCRLACVVLCHSVDSGVSSINEAG